MWLYSSLSDKNIILFILYPVSGLILKSWKVLSPFYKNHQFGKINVPKIWHLIRWFPISWWAKSWDVRGYGYSHFTDLGLVWSNRVVRHKWRWKNWLLRIHHCCNQQAETFERVKYCNGVLAFWPRLKWRNRDLGA